MKPLLPTLLLALLLSGCSHVSEKSGPAFLKVGSKYEIFWAPSSEMHYGNLAAEKNDFKILKKESSNWYLVEWTTATYLDEKKEFLYGKERRWMNLDHALSISEAQ